MKHSGRGHTLHPMRVIREAVVQSLYGWLIHPHQAAVEQRMDSEAQQVMYVAYLQGCIEISDEAKEHITSKLTDHQWSRLFVTEQAIMILVYYELAMRHEVPYRVVLNESIELAKKYGGDESPKFINGLADQLAPQLRVLEITMQKNTLHPKSSDVSSK